LEKAEKKEAEVPLTENNLDSLDKLIPAVVRAVGFDWAEVQEVAVDPGKEVA
jgi:hypothetical protein